jgi:hypothetical protein
LIKSPGILIIPSRCPNGLRRQSVLLFRILRGFLNEKHRLVLLGFHPNELIRLDGLLFGWFDGFHHETFRCVLQLLPNGSFRQGEFLFRAHGLHLA